MAIKEPRIFKVIDYMSGDLFVEDKEIIDGLPEHKVDYLNEDDEDAAIYLDKRTLLTSEELKIVIRSMGEPEKIFDYVVEIVNVKESIWDSSGKDLDINKLKEYSLDLLNRIDSANTGYNGMREKIIDVLSWCQKRKNEIGFKILPKSTIQFIPESELDINELALRQEYNFLEDYIKKLEEIIYVK